MVILAADWPVKCCTALPLCTPWSWSTIAASLRDDELYPSGCMLMDVSIRSTEEADHRDVNVLQGLKDTMGLNMAALTFLQRSRREEAGVSDADAILPAKRQLAAMES